MSLFTPIRNSLYTWGLFLLIAGLASACIFEDELVKPQDNALNEAYLKIQLDLPEMTTPTSANGKTRSMSEEAERVINLDLLHILVFKSTGEFYYKAPVVGSIVYDDQDRTKATVTVKLVKSDSASEEFNFGIVANYDLPASALTSTTTKSDLKNALKYELLEKWNASNEGYTPFPMWGETGNLVISKTMAMPTVDMYRALARIDVGLNFAQVDGKLSETATGMPEFKLKEIYVYRTNKSGFVAPLTLRQVHIPSDAVLRDDNSPLVYTLPEEGGGNSYVREIYVPEAALPGTPQNSNMHAVVIAGYYKGSTTPSYYRLDFAQEVSATQVRTYLPIVRNHRYVFNVTAVRGPGYDTPEEALESVPTIENIGYDLIEFDETIHDMEVNGKYYFGLDTRKLQLTPQPTSEEETNQFTIKYKTNYPLSDSEALGLTWENPAASALFHAVWNRATNEITITALTENVTNTILSEVLNVKAGPITIPVVVEQRYVNFKYLLNCEDVVVHGNYEPNKALNATHKITLSFTAEDRSTQGKSFEIETVDQSEDGHGISFRASGKFDFSKISEGAPLKIPVTLEGTGTLTNAKPDESFKLRIKSNSSSGSYCEATITPVGRKLRVLALGIGNGHGYNISEIGRGSHLLLTSPYNFGDADYSVVKTQGFEFVNGTTYWDAATSSLSPTIEKIKNWLSPDSEDRVDILHVGHNTIVYANSTTYPLAGYIANFIKNKGVVVVFNEYDTSINIANEVFDAVNVTGHYIGAGGNLFRLKGDSASVADLYHFDPIVNGAFGDIRGTVWGEDATATYAIANLPKEEVVVYSTGEFANDGSAYTNPNGANQATAFRHKTLNYLWIGDGGFNSSYLSTLVANTTTYPFWWEPVTYRPSPKPKFGWGTRTKSIYNSHLFCNIMAWAIDRATHDGINTNK